MSFNFKPVAFFLFFLMMQTQMHAQLNNFGNLHVFSATTISLASFSNKAGADYQNDGTVFLSGDFTNDQLLLASGLGTTEFNGASLQNINGSENAAFHNLNVNNTSGINLATNSTIDGVLTFVSGKIQTNSFRLIMPAASNVSGAGQTTGWVFGNLKKGIATGANFTQTFEIGDNLNYTPASISLNNVTAAGNITANVTGTDHYDLSNSAIYPNKSVNRYWTFSTNNATFDNASVTLNWAPSDVDAGANTANFNMAEYAGGSWSLHPAISSSATSLQATGFTSLGDFVAGESSCTTAPNMPGTVTGQQLNLCSGGVHNYSIDPVATATSYTWNLPSDITATNDLGTSITLTIPSGIDHDQIFITANNACGISAAKIFNLWGKPSQPIISGPTVVTANQTVTYTIPNAEIGVTYTWKFIPSVSIISGQGTANVRVKWSSRSGAILCDATNNCGQWRASYFVTVNSGFAKAGNSLPYINEMLSIYPNPAQSETKVIFTAVTESKYVIELTDVTGKAILRKEIAATTGSNEVVINVSMYSSGLYFINLIGNNEVKKIKLIKQK